MPLDSAAYLTSLGWQGTGNALRKGGMAKPLAIPQKRTLSGVGKDRDEAFPFWDHVFTAAANSIKIKVHNDDSDRSDAESEQSNTPGLILSRTSTGIISNRRPTSSIPICGSGSITPQDDPNRSRLSLLAQAKRQAAYAKLYASFYKGPVIAPLKDEYNSTANEAEEETTTEKTDAHDTTADAQTNNSLRKAKDSKDYKPPPSDSSKRQKKRPSKGKSNTETYLFEDSEQILDEGKDKLTKRRHSKQEKLAETDLSLEHDLDNKTDLERKRKSDVTGEEAEESRRKRKEGSKRKKVPFEDGNDERAKRKKSKVKTVTGVNHEDAVAPEEHKSRLKDNIDSNNEKR